MIKKKQQSSNLIRTHIFTAFLREEILKGKFGKEPKSFKKIFSSHESQNGKLNDEY